MKNFLKGLAKIYKWILISIILQYTILLIINNVVLVKKIDKDTTYSKIDDNTTGITRLVLVDGATDYKVSFDSKYAAYLNNNKIEIIDLSNKQTVHTINGEFVVVERIKDRDSFSAIISYFEWINDRNILIYSVRAPDEEEGVVQLVTYSLETGKTHGFPPAMYKMPAGSETVDVEYSTKTNVIYTKVKVSPTRADIYRYNILDQISYVFSTNSEITFFKLNLTDHFVFQDRNNKLSVWSGETSEVIPISVDKDIKLLGVDADDNIYIGELEGNSIGKIYYGKFGQVFSQWEWFDSGKTIPVENIIITESGKIFEIQYEKSNLIEIPAGETIYYKGEFIELTDRHIISIDNNELVIHQLK